MSNYYTRGTSHGSSKTYDVRFNRQFCWTMLFDVIAAFMLEEVKDVRISTHVLDRINGDLDGNRDFSVDELKSLLNSLPTCSLAEIEAQGIRFQNGKEAFIVKKLLLRSPERGDGENVCVVLDFTNPVYPRVKTAYLNKGNDNHDVGLNIRELEFCTNCLFGFENRFGEAEVFSTREKDGKSYYRNEFIVEM